jgi:bifunctional DNA-binding transcriptional regulator/antitoxin component of YhaV-PrlF toxin-antitoxin module
MILLYPYSLTYSKDLRYLYRMRLSKEENMSILSQKRQITLPKGLCDKLLVQPGDDLSFLEHGGRITIIKKIKGSSDGVLSRLSANAKYTDKDSLEDAIANKRRVQKAKN